ncbi:MAG: transporter [Chthoniobacterales bacterium]
MCLSFSRNKPSKDNPGGKDTFGFGDVLIQAALIDEFSKRWAAGLGPRLVLPTASQDQFGTDRIEIGPIGGVRYSLLEISQGSFVELVTGYDCDTGGQRGRSHISRIRWSPTLNINLPQKWFVTFFPSQDVAVNFLDGGKWFFPFDFLIGKRLSSRMVVTLETGVPIVKNYNLYEFALRTRFSFTF